MTLTFRVAAKEAGMRLDAVLARQSEIPSRAAAGRLADAGRVTVAGEAAAKSRRVASGDEIAVELAEGPRGGSDTVAFEVVHEDAHLLVVDKPAGVVVHPARGTAGLTLAEALGDRARGGTDPARAGIVHRLDRDTSGLLVVAKSQEAWSGLTAMLRERRVRRAYLALVAGRPPSHEGTIDAPLGRDRRRRAIRSSDSASPRPAVTHFEIVESLPLTALLRVRLETGRTHQIRAHLAAIGHPVCGDRQYGGRRDGRRLGLERQFLHAAELAFSHPITREQMRCESKPPADLRRALDAARREPVSGGPDGD